MFPRWKLSVILSLRRLITRAFRRKPNIHQKYHWSHPSSPSASAQNGRIRRSRIFGIRDKPIEDAYHDLLSNHANPRSRPCAVSCLSKIRTPGLISSQVPTGHRSTTPRTTSYCPQGPLRHEVFLLRWQEHQPLDLWSSLPDSHGHLPSSQRTANLPHRYLV